MAPEGMRRIGGYKKNEQGKVVRKTNKEYKAQKTIENKQAIRAENIRINEKIKQDVLREKKGIQNPKYKELSPKKCEELQRLVDRFNKGKKGEKQDMVDEINTIISNCGSGIPIKSINNFSSNTSINLHVDPLSQQIGLIMNGKKLWGGICNAGVSAGKNGVQGGVSWEKKF